MRSANYFDKWIREPAEFVARRFEEELDKLRGGGPPTPMHPVPAFETRRKKAPGGKDRRPYRSATERSASSPKRGSE
jgi:hypothetical protein